MPSLLWNGTAFVLRCSFDERYLAKDAGFRWLNNEWVTDDPGVAAKLRDYSTHSARFRLRSLLIEDSPWLSPLPSPPPRSRLVLMPHQREALYFALDRNRCYLGLDPGLGKTAVAALATTGLGMPTVYLAPPFLLRNVEAEYSQWAPYLRVSTYGPWAGGETHERPDVLIIPDSMLSRDKPAAMVKHLFRFLAGRRGALVVDEAHRFKTFDAQRTKALFGVNKQRGLVGLFHRCIYLSGTPMPNRPMELFPILSRAAPETIDFMNQWAFGRRYCAGYKSRWGWDFAGASNVEELARKVIYPTGPFMLRQRKDILDLPPKIEEAFVISANMSPKLASLETNIRRVFGDNIDAVVKHQLAAAVGADDIHLATYRRLLGVEKVAASAEYISAVLDDEPEEKLIVFAWHKEVIAELAGALNAYSPLVVKGDTPAACRQDIVDTFQRDPGRRLLIGNYGALGVGVTLTAARRVVSVEFDWTPAVNDQAGDRAHRIGQKRTVYHQFIVYRDSLDSDILTAILRKRKATNHI